jgi:hypothetical protein
LSEKKLISLDIIEARLAAAAAAAAAFACEMVMHNVLQAPILSYPT